MIDLAMRKHTLEAIGWSESRNGRDIYHWAAIETDPGLAIKGLDEFCKKNEWTWVLSFVSLNDGYNAMIITKNYEDDFPEGTASEPALAICLALVAASQAQKGQS